MDKLCSDVFAEPMLDNDDFLRDYAEALQSLQDQKVLPRDMKEEMPFKVYSIEGSGCGPHRSVVLSSNDKTFFTVELGLIKVHGTKRIYPVTEEFDASKKSKLSYHGEVKMSAGTLISRAVATMKKFGSYFKFCNNCQHFCNCYLESIGLGETKKLTDSEKTTLVAMAVTLLGILLMLLFKTK